MDIPFLVIFRRIKVTHEDTDSSAVEKFVKVCNTPLKIYLWTWHNIWYQKDIKTYEKSEYWATPKETLINRAGDCEDFSILVKSALTKLGYKSFLFIIYNKNPERGFGREAHLTCIYYEPKNGHYYSICNFGRNDLGTAMTYPEVVHNNAPSLDKFATKILPEWVTWRVTNERNENVFIRPELREV